MFKQGDVIFVGSKGVCTVNDIKQNAFIGCDKTKEYYVLKPLESTTNMVVFLPTDTPIKIRKLITKNKALEILKDIKNFTFENTINDTEKYSLCAEILKDVEIENRLKVLNFLIDKKLNTSKKNFSLQDQKLIETLTTCICNELSYVLDKPFSTIKEEILNQLNQQKNSKI